MAAVEAITEGVNNISIGDFNGKRNQIQVSNTKKPLFFYVNLAKRYMQQHNDVQLSDIGVEIMTSTVDMKEDGRGRSMQKAKVGGMSYQSIFYNYYCPIHQLAHDNLLC